MRRSGALPGGVSDGTRTRDISDHNRVLYQLSYTHHRRTLARAPSRSVAGAQSGADDYDGSITCFAAIAFACSESGPGCGTNSASR